MLLGEYIYGGHWPLDFGSLEIDDYTATKIQGVRAKFDTFCFHYISELLQDIDIG